MVIPVLVALDTSDLGAAVAMANTLHGRVAGFKVGLELMMSHGPEAISEVASIGSPVFADAKLHDIPNTIRRAAAELAKHGARWVTAHASGGSTMVEAAVEGLQGTDAGILAVSVLTSLDDDDLTEVGIPHSIVDQVERLSRLAAASGVEGMICSPAEATIVKTAESSLLTVTPGVRMPGDDAHDQKRLATPSEAVSDGADLLVMGRAITRALDPLATVSEIEEMLGAQSRP